jgi:hypothetical protein
VCTWTPGQCRAWRRVCRHLQSETRSSRDDTILMHCLGQNLAYSHCSRYAADKIRSTAAMAAAQGGVGTRPSRKRKAATGTHMNHQDASTLRA